jgi:hypothetical protein
MYVKDGGSVPHESRGWQGRMSPERYAAELQRVQRNAWRRIADLSACDSICQLDYANREWASF